MTMNIALVALGGSLGAVLRYLLVSGLNTQFAYGTLLANSLGSLLAGVFVVVISQSGLSEEYKLALLVGLCGSLTTLSAISLDSVQYYLSGQHTIAVTSLLANIVLALVCVVLGMILAKACY